MNNQITVKFVVEAGFSPEVVSLFAKTSVASDTLRKLIMEREMARLARKASREGCKLAVQLI